MRSFAEHLYFYSPIQKDIEKVLQEAPEVIDDIISSFCLRSNFESVWDLIRLQSGAIVVISDPSAIASLELYQHWQYSWSIHGMDAPLLDIQSDES